MRQLKLQIVVITSLIFSPAFIAAANAQLSGSTVNVSAYYPDSSSVYTDPGDRIVSAVVEYPSGSYPFYNPSWQVDITNSQLIITDALSTGLPFGSASFNGFILEMISGPTIASATVNPSSTLLPVSVTVEGGNRILANFQGVEMPNGGSAIIDINAVPEPTTVGMFGLGLAILAVGRRNRR